MSLALLQLLTSCYNYYYYNRYYHYYYHHVLPLLTTTTYHHYLLPLLTMAHVRLALLQRGGGR